MIKDLCLPEIFECFSLLNSIYFLCLSTQISQENNESLSLKIVDFLDCFSRVFSKYRVTINFHELVHIPQIIANIGPLQNFSCYGFENLNRLLRNFIHGTKDVDKEIFKRFEYSHSAFRSHNSSICTPFQEITQGLIKPVESLKISRNLGASLRICGSFFSF